MKLKPWYERKHRRLKVEIEEMISAFNHMLLMETEGGEPFWYGYVIFKGNKHYIFIRYPAQFPQRRPILNETEPPFKITEGVDYRETFHQLPDKSICLFPYDFGPEGWKQEYTAADVLRKFLVFLEVTERGEHKDEHTSIRPDFAGKQDRRIFIVPKTAVEFILHNGAQWGFFNSQRAIDDRPFRLVTKVSKEYEENGFTIGDEWDQVCAIKHAEHGIWCLTSAPSEGWYEGIRTKEKIFELARSKLPSPLHYELENANVVLFIYESNGTYRCVAYPLVDEEGKPIEQLKFCRAEIMDIMEEIFKRPEGVMSSGIKILKEQEVIMVGLGSLGSTITLELAKAGVANFVLYDPEYLEPVNVARHTGDLNEVFNYKVSVLKNQIFRRNPQAEVLSIPDTPLYEGIQEKYSKVDKFMKRLTPSTLLIVAIAEHEIESAINSIALASGATAIYASILGNAQYGRMFRVIPGETPCFDCIAGLNTAYPDKFPVFEGHTITEESTNHVGHYRQPGIPGVGIDVSIIALLTARFALQTIFLINGDKISYPDDGHHHLLWGNEEGWVFNNPLESIPYEYPRVKNCPACGEASEIAPLSTQESEELASLKESAKNIQRLL